MCGRGDVLPTPPGDYLAELQPGDTLSVAGFGQRTDAVGGVAHQSQSCQDAVCSHGGVRGALGSVLCSIHIRGECRENQSIFVRTSNLLL